MAYSRSGERELLEYAIIIEFHAIFRKLQPFRVWVAGGLQWRHFLKTFVSPLQDRSCFQIKVQVCQIIRYILTRQMQKTSSKTDNFLQIFKNFQFYRLLWVSTSQPLTQGKMDTFSKICSICTGEVMLFDRSLSMLAYKVALQERNAKTIIENG